MVILFILRFTLIDIIILSTKLIDDR